MQVQTDNSVKDQNGNSSKPLLVAVFECRESSYFNDKDVYEFKNSLGTTYKSKANFDKGFWWLNDYYKATSVLCRLVSCH